MSAKQRTFWTASTAAPLTRAAPVLMVGLLACTAAATAPAAAEVRTATTPLTAVVTPASAPAAPLSAGKIPPGKATAKVSADGAVLKVRSGPATDKRTVTSLADGAKVKVRCQSWGESVTGIDRASPYWNRIDGGQYVGDAFIRWFPARPEVPWCGVEPVDATQAHVATDGSVLNVRSGPGTRYRLVGRADAGIVLPVRCQSWGEEIRGTARTSIWAQVGEGRYVSDAFVSWAPQRPWLPWCGQEGPSIAAGTSAGFISRAVVPARIAQRTTGVPTSVTLAQAVLESGWGRSRLARDDHNIFGMTCARGPGPIALGCRDYTSFGYTSFAAVSRDCAGSGCRKTTQAQFRAYRDDTDSYIDHGQAFSTAPRYAEAMRHTDDPDRFVREIHKAGYATETNYSTKVIDLMKQYDLYQYDIKL